MNRILSVTTCLCAPLFAQAQTIDFETLPGGAPTTDQQVISTEYQAAFGVSFELLDRTSGLPIGFPRIAKVGNPQTAFASCEGGDTPLAGQGLGSSFLTDNSSVGVSADLLITYDNPVIAASGVILDVDCRSPAGSPPCEQWTIEALDSGGGVIDTKVITAPTGPSQGTCNDPNGFGDARSFGWTFTHGVADIAQVRLRYTGAATSVGLGFDLFSPAQGVGPLEATASLSDSEICEGDLITLIGEATGGVPPYQFFWEREDGGAWTSVSNLAEDTTRPLVGDTYRFRVVDNDGTEFIAGPVAPDIRPLRLMVSQESAPGLGDFDANPIGEVVPLDTAGTLSAYYGWTSTNAQFNGPAPALVNDQSHLFFVRGTDGLGLFIVHDDIGGAGGGRAEMRLEFTGVGPDLLARDDQTNDSYSVDTGTGVIRMRQTWQDVFTDGIAAGPLDGEWSVLVQFRDEYSGDPTIDGLTKWSAYADSVTTLTLALESDRRVRIVATCAPCVADLTGDGVVDGADLAALLAAWGSPCPLAGPLCPPDLTGDGNVDGADLAALLAAWGACS